MADQDPLRRPGSGRARRLARALGLGGLIALAPAAAPAAADAAGVVVRLGGTVRALGPDEVRASVDRPAGSYGLRARGTAAEPIAHPPALSLRRLVVLAGGTPDAVSFVSVQRPNGTLALLGRGDLADPPPFPEGPPIVWIDGDGVRYLRPLRGPDDVNATDNVNITSADLRVRVHQGPLLTVRARADRRTVPAGEVVSLTAAVTGPAQPPGLTFRWSFGDGTSKDGAAVRHRFDRPGTYEVVAEASGSDDSGGSSLPLLIRVGRAVRSERGGSGGGTGDPERAPARGPARGGERDSGSSSPGKGEGTGGERDGGTPSGSEGADRGGGEEQPPTPTPTTPAPAAPTTTQAPAPPAATTPQTTPRPAPPVRPRSRARRERRAPRRNREPVVRGLLVAARTTAVLPPVPSASGAGAQAAARRGSDLGAEPLGALAGVLAVALLFGAGAWREGRGLHGRAEASR